MQSRDYAFQQNMLLVSKTSTPPGPPLTKGRGKILVTGKRSNSAMYWEKIQLRSEEFKARSTAARIR